MKEIASREFMDNLTSLLKSYEGPAVNHDVKAKILDLIQSWSGAAEGRYELIYIGEVYRQLQREGFRFPPKVVVASSVYDTSAVGIHGPIKGRHLLTMSLCSLQSGRTRTSACDAVRLLHLPIENTTVGIVATSSAGLARASQYPYPISAYLKLGGWTMVATRS